MGIRFKDLKNCSVFSTLTKLAETPFDLTDSKNMNIDRVKEYQVTGAGFKLYYSTQRVDEDVLNCLQTVAEESGLVKQFCAMKSGAVINRIEGFQSENRQVLHTAVRDVFSKNACEPAATAQAEVELEKLKKFLSDLKGGKIVNGEGDSFTTMVQVGIGGSDLGPRSVYEALKAFQLRDRKVYFISNVDPDDAEEVLRQVDIKRTLFNIVSKSGTTLETLTNEKLIRNALVVAGLDPREHCIAVTGEGSPMDNPSECRTTFYMYDYIGGRYSGTSMVGLVVLGFALGYEQIVEFLQGACEMDYHAEKANIRKNIPLLMALLGVWNHNFLGFSTVAVLPYSQSLHRFAAHLQQCDMESNGKSVSRKGAQLEINSGPIVWGEPGTNGQHAFYQLLHQGTEVVPAEFIGFLESQYEKDIKVEGTTSQQKLVANLLAQIVALATGKDNDNPNKVFKGNRPNLLLSSKKLTPKTMGALLACYEAKIVFQGFLWDINSFDQEGVQLGKVLASRFLVEMVESGAGSTGWESQLLKEVISAES